MKNYALLITVLTVFVACKNNNSNTTSTEPLEKPKVEADQKAYPETISKVLAAHGGVSQWNAMNYVCFEIDGRGGEEVHTVALKSRKAKIETENWIIGNDGNETWLLENTKETYKGNAAFYNNLMFYFYAMPFVFADDGIVYTQMPQRKLEGTTYNVLKIGYNDGVGYSSKDEYLLFSDPTTNKMTWLGYTVTGTSNKKSDKWSYIKYSNWETINGLALPKTISWYTVKENEPVEKRNDLTFNKVTITETQLGATFLKCQRMQL